MTELYYDKSYVIGEFFRRLWSGKIQVFQAPTGYSTADKAFIADLCDNIFKFHAKFWKFLNF